LTAQPLYPLHIPVRLGDHHPLERLSRSASWTQHVAFWLAGLQKPLRHASTGLPTPPAEDAHQGTHAATNLPVWFSLSVHFALCRARRFGLRPGILQRIVHMSFAAGHFV
jgi:hypothetical protein